MIPPIIKSAERQNLKEVIRLVENGVSVDTIDETGWTPLLSAVHSGNVKMVQYLLSKGASLFPKGARISALDKTSGNPKIVKLLQQESVKQATENKARRVALADAYEKRTTQSAESEPFKRIAEYAGIHVPKGTGRRKTRKANKKKK